MNLANLKDTWLIQKSVVFLYPNLEISKSERKKYYLKSNQKQVKYLRRNQGVESLKHLKHWWRKLKIIQGNGELSLALGLEEVTLLKWPYCQKQSMYLIQSLQ